jgi:hypothetical protein
MYFLKIGIKMKIRFSQIYNGNKVREDLRSIINGVIKVI